MPITIAGSGTITGISAGGLPDDSIIAADIAAGAVTTAKVADANITAAKLSGAQSGSAPIYGARAWVNFDGNSGSIGSGRASGNVSSVTDNGTGNYTVNFATAMPDSNYAVVAMAEPSDVPGVGATFYTIIGSNSSTPFTRTTSSAQIRTAYVSSISGATSPWDCQGIHIAIFR